MPSSAQPAQNMTGQLINGRFELSGLARTDGFGEIIHAIDHKTRRQVSLRSLGSPALAGAVRAEVKALSQLAHPNLLRVYGVVKNTDGSPMLVQGAVPDFTLEGYLQARSEAGRPVGFQGASNILEAVYQGLKALHQISPHGAVRPSCVWVGDNGRVQLADAALSKAALSLGATAVPPDVIAYIAPELKLGRPATVATDVFGLGSLAYLLLTGRAPSDEFVLPSAIHGPTCTALDQELLRALAADPAERHPSPEAFRDAIKRTLEPSQLAGQTAISGSDPDSLEIDVSLSLAPPKAGPSIPVTVDIRNSSSPSPGEPTAGARIAADSAFRSTAEEGPEAASAAQERRSLGEVDLKDVLAKITEDDSPRWMVVKEGMDHGPFSGRQLVNMIVQGDAIAAHELMNTDTGRRAKLSEFDEFQEFVQQYELRRFEQERAQALAHAETREKKSVLFKVGIGLSAVAVLAVVGVLYALTRSDADATALEDAELDMYKRGEVAISGSAGILPMPRGGARRGVRRSGGALSYEDAMMQAVELGDAKGGGGEQQLSAATVAGVMNGRLNQLFRACVRGKAGKVKIDIAIAGSGEVLGVSVNGGDAALQRCVAGQVRGIRFPRFSAPRMGARYSFDT